MLSSEDAVANILFAVLFGGTNWGQTAEPTVYTSYDYGAGKSHIVLLCEHTMKFTAIVLGINENRVVTPKMNEMRQQGQWDRIR